MSRRRGGCRRLLAAIAVGGVVAGVATVGTGPAAVSAPASGVQISGGGSWGPYRELITWQNDLGAAKVPIDLRYTPHGSFLGRADFAAGKSDFVLSGVPFSADELAQIDGGATGVVDAPVQVSSLAFLVREPFPNGFVTQEVLCNPDDPNVPDPTKCLVNTPYAGAVRIPTANLAAMALGATGNDGDVPITSWNAPSVLGAFGVASLTTPPLAGPSPVQRSDQDETSFYLQSFVATAAPSVWTTLEADPRFVWEPISERLPRLSAVSRDGVTQQVATFARSIGDPAGGGVSQFTAGSIAPAPASSYGEAKEVAPQALLAVAQMQNAAGEWVAPTPDSITAAVNAGGDAPLFALTHDTPGAYPLVWIDHLYAPAHGLSIAKTEALATTIRYLATAGQDAAKPVGEGRLSDSLVKQSLAAADALVTSNCTGTDAKIIVNDLPGPDAPDAPVMQTIGTMQHCVSKSGSGGNGTLSASDFSSSSSSFASGTTPSATPASTVTGSPQVVGETTKTVDGVLVAHRLPFPLPGGSGTDRVATVLLGVGAYFLFRRPVRRLLDRGAT